MGTDNKDAPGKDRRLLTKEAPPSPFCQQDRAWRIIKMLQTLSGFSSTPENL